MNIGVLGTGTVGRTLAGWLRLYGALGTALFNLKVVR